MSHADLEKWQAHWVLLCSILLANYLLRKTHLRLSLTSVPAAHTQVHGLFTQFDRTVQAEGLFKVRVRACLPGRS